MNGSCGQGSGRSLMEIGGATGDDLTSVWTILSSVVSSFFSTMSIAIRVPVRPTPAWRGYNNTIATPSPQHTHTIPPPSTYLHLSTHGQWSWAGVVIWHSLSHSSNTRCLSTPSSLATSRSNTPSCPISAVWMTRLHPPQGGSNGCPWSYSATR